MVKIVAPLWLMSSLAFAQASLPSVQTKAACSPVVTGNGNTITIETCGMTNAQIQEWRASLRQILDKQVDPKVLVALLDDIKTGQIRIENGVLRIEKDVQELRNSQGWVDLSSEQVALIADAAKPFAGQKALVDVPYWERDTERLARQLAQALTSVGWSVPVDGQGQTRFYSRNAKLPVGIVVSRKEDTPAFVSIAMALLKIFGKESISGFRDATLADGFIKITVWRKP